MPARASRAVTVAHTNDLVVEIGTEELPASFILPALDQIREAAARLLAEHRLTFRGPVETYGTPRRLVLVVPRLAARQADQETEVTGPPKATAFDAEGRPTSAAVGFAKAHGVPVGQLVIKKTPRGEVAAVVKRARGKPTATVLADLLPRLIVDLAFPKTMRWDGSGAKFARPIRWLLALHGPTPIRFSFAGLKSGNRTVTSPVGLGRAVAIPSAAVYHDRLAAARVVIDPVRREAAVVRQLAALAKRYRGRVVRDGYRELLTRVVFETEEPIVMAGAFEKDYLKMPQEVIISIMREHQAYFSLENTRGALLPVFLCVLNHRPGRPALVRQGHERVLRARLEDARFYFEKDQQVKLADRVEQLRGVVEHEAFGTTMYHKTERLQALVGELAHRFQFPPEVRRLAERAAFLAKADLLTGMVGEFPVLQGIVGREYAWRQSEPVEVADAIAEHYQPRFAGDRLPKTTVGRLLAVADKLDTIRRYFVADLIPTGSEDPYALRRHGLGLFQILLELEADWKGKIGDPVNSIRGLVELAQWARGEQKGIESKRVNDQVVKFLRGRADSLLRQEGAAYDSIECVFSQEPDDLVDAVQRVRALERFRKRPECEPMLVAYRRTWSITMPHRTVTADPDRAVFTEPAEQRLYDTYRIARQAVTRALDERQYEAALSHLVRLTEPINTFFDDVLVMAEEAAVRDRRLSLLSHVVDLYERFGAFSRLVVEGQSG